MDIPSCLPSLMNSFHSGFCSSYATKTAALFKITSDLHDAAASALFSVLNLTWFVSCTGSSRAPPRLIHSLVSCRRQLCRQTCDGCSPVTPYSSHLLFLPLPPLKRFWDAVFIFSLCLPISQNINCSRSDTDVHFLPKAVTASTVKAAILMAAHCVGAKHLGLGPCTGTY